MALRILQEGDYLPDFYLTNSQHRLHTASLAGTSWILLVFRAPLSEQSLAEIVERFRQWRLPIVPAIVTTHRSQPEFEPRTDVYRITGSSLSAFLLGDDSTGKEFNCLVIDRGMKILRRVDDMDSIGDAKEYSGDPDRNQNAPVLGIPNALSREFCHYLISRFKGANDKIRGQGGLSVPRLDLEYKRSFHINADRELAGEIDGKLLFSTLPAIERFFDIRVTHRALYKISCYDSNEAGFFAAHRDNSDRRFLYNRLALIVALNEDWEGDGVVFPEFSNRTFEMATGDALVFPASVLHRVGPIRAGKRFVLISNPYDGKSAQLRRATAANPELLDGIYDDRIPDELLAAYEAFAPAPRFSPQYDPVEAFSIVALLRGAVPPETSE